MADSGSDGTRKRGGRTAFAPQVAGAGAARLEVEVGVGDAGRGTGLDNGVASPLPTGSPDPDPASSAAAPGPAGDDDEAPPSDEEARRLLVRRQMVAESRAKLEAGMALAALRHADRVSATKTTSFDRLRKSKSGRALAASADAPAPAGAPAPADAAPAGPTHVPLGAGVSLSGEPLDYDAAWAHNLETSPSEVLEGGRRRKFSPFSTTTGRLLRDFDVFHEGYQSDFVSFGAGVTAFFKVRKFFYVMWAILAVFAAPSIYVNWFALGNAERQPASPVSLTTLRGFYVQSANAGAPFNLPSGMSVKPSDALVAYAALDCIGAILLLAGFLWASYEIPKEGSRLHAGGATTVAGYSVFVQHLPTRATEDDIVRWVDGIAVAEKLLSGQGVGFALPVLRPDAEPLGAAAAPGAGSAAVAAKTAKSATAAVKTSGLARQASSPSKWGSKRTIQVDDKAAGADEVKVAIADVGSADAAGKAGKKAGKGGKAAPADDKAAAANEPPPPPPPPGLWPIVDVSIVSDNHEILDLLYRRAEVLRRLDRVNELLRARNRRALSCVDELLGCFSRGELADERAKLKRSTRKCDADLMRVRLQNTAGGGACAAFITFESTQDAAAFAKLFSAAATASAACASLVRSPLKKPHLKLLGKRVTVSPAPEPSAVLWGNLHLRTKHQWARIVGSTFASLLLVLFSFGIMYVAAAAAAAFKQHQQPADCAERSVSAFVQTYLTFHTSLDEQQLQNGTNPGTYTAARTFCVCDTLPWQSYDLAAVQSSPWLNACATQACSRLLDLDLALLVGQPVCESFVKLKSFTSLVSLAATVVVLITNEALRVAFDFFAWSEGHHTAEMRGRSVAERVFVAQFFNTAVLTIIVNAAWPGQSSAATGAMASLRSAASTGKFADLSGEWYDEVGTQIVTTMLLTILTPNLYPLLEALFKTLQWRRKLPARVLSQAHLLELYEGGEMNAPGRLASMMNIAFVTYAFSTGMPLLTVVGAFAFFVGYWADKLLFTRYFRLPPLESPRSVERIFSFLPIAVLLHLAFGAWALGTAWKASGGPPSSLAAQQSLAALGVVVPTPVNDASTASGVVTLYDDGTGSGLAFHVDGLTLPTRADLYSYYYNHTESNSDLYGTIEGGSRLLTPAALPLVVLFAITLVVTTANALLGLMGASLLGALDFVLCGSLTDIQGGIEVDDEVDIASKASVQPVFSVAASPLAVGTPLALVGPASYDMLLQPDVRSELHLSNPTARRGRRRESILDVVDKGIDEDAKGISSFDKDLDTDY